MRAASTFAWALPLLGCGPLAAGGDEAGATSTGSLPSTTDEATTTATTTSTTSLDPTGTDPATGTTSSECRSLDLPCPGWCLSDWSCDIGHVCVDETCTPGPFLPVCDELPLEAVNWGLAHAPAALALVDLDADGDLDLAVVEPAVAQLELLINDGAGEFAPGGAAALGPGFELAAIATGDLDGDADLDLVIARADAGDVLVLLADGGAWVPGPTLTGPAATQLFVADVDGFGGRDVLAVSAAEPALTLWRGDGLGGFAERQDMPVSLTPLASVADVTLDGLPDVVAPYFFAIAVYRGRPNSWFEDVGGLSFGGFNHVHRQVIATQLDAGPEIELAALVGDAVGSMVHVRRASVDPEPGWTLVDHGVRLAATPISARVADITGDGAPDLIAATTTDALMLLPGDGAGGFACEALVPAPTALTHDLLAVGDVDGDGRADIVAAGPRGGELWVLRAL